MQLFDQIELTEGRILPSESGFHYMQRSAEPMFVNLRERLTQWSERIPLHHRMPLIERIRQKDNETHEAAIFELFVHEFLIKKECKVLEYEPTFDNYRPDFLVESKSNEEFLVEASIVNGRTKEDRCQEGIRWEIQTAIDELPRISQHLHLHFQGTFSNSPSRQKIKSLVLKWLGEQNRPVEKIFSVSGASFTLKTFCETSKGFSGPTVSCITFGDAEMIYPQGDIKKKLKRKAKQIAASELPAVIALSLPLHFRDSFTVSSALLGDEVMHINSESGQVVRTTRKDNAALFFKGRPNNSSITGILSFPHSCIHSDEFVGEYWENPWGRHPFSKLPFYVPRWLPNRTKGIMEFQDCEE